MKNMALIVGILAVFALSPPCDARKLSVVTEAWPPLVIQNQNGSASGYDYEVMAAVLASLGIEFTFEFLPWKRAVMNVRQHASDAILAIIDTEERRQFLTYPEEPLSSGGYVIFHPRQRPFTYTDLESLRDKVVGTVDGYTYTPEFINARHFRKEAVNGDDALERNLHKLIGGRIELVIANKSVALYTAKRLDMLDKIDYTDRYVGGESQFYLAFSTKEGNQVIAQHFSDALRHFKQTEAYRDIMARYGLIKAAPGL